MKLILLRDKHPQQPYTLLRPRHSKGAYAVLALYAALPMKFMLVSLHVQRRNFRPRLHSDGRSAIRRSSQLSCYNRHHTNDADIEGCTAGATEPVYIICHSFVDAGSRRCYCQVNTFAVTPPLTGAVEFSIHGDCCTTEHAKQPEWDDGI